MQPEVTVALATIWLLVSLLGGRGAAAATLHPSYLPPDQYSPLPPRHPQVYQTVGGQLYWKDQDDRHEDQPFDLSIGPRRSHLLDEAPRDLLHLGYPGKEYTRRPEDRSDNFPPLKVEQAKQAENFAGSKLSGEEEVEDNGGRKAGNQESFSSEASPPGVEDPFVADDTFQDQGPGSVEIYKLDLVKEKALLSPSSTTKAPMKNKSKLPKKTSHLNWKAKTAESKTSNPKILHRQSNFFDQLQTDIPPNSESFGAGGVPELQVGCEGLEASSHKLKRSIDSLAKEKTPRSEGNPLPDVTPISIDLEYDLSAEEAYEEMDELLKLKKLEATTKRPKQNRGDMDATLHGNEFFADKKPDKLPVRGDLGKSSTPGASNLEPPALLANNRSYQKDVNQYANKARKLLSLQDPADENTPPRNKRSVWGYGEEEGVVSSDELQTENQRRRQHYERRRLEELRRREQGRNQTETQIHDIRQEYEHMLELRKTEEEERRRRFGQDSSQRAVPNGWREEEERREELRRRQHEEHLRRMHYNRPDTNYQATERPRIDERFNPQPDHSDNNYRPRQRMHEEQERQREQQRQESERRRQKYEEARRRYEEEQQRRREQNRSQEGSQRNLSAEEQRRLEERRREWIEKEEERRREQNVGTQAPSNLVYPHRSAANESRQRDPETERRMREREEHERERKLREYIQRNQPINVNRSGVNRRDETPQTRSPEAERRDDPYRNMTSRRDPEEEQRRRAEEHRRRFEENRRSQEEARRKQSLGSGTEGERKVPGKARSYDYFRYPGTEIERRAHGPSAPTHASPRGYPEDARRRQESRRVEDERQRRDELELRKEMLRREEALRRMQSRRYEEERKRQEAQRQESERRRKELVEEQARRSHGRNRPVENRRPEYEDHRIQQHRRRPDTSLIPSNLVFDEARRAAERERQRQDQERSRLEAERRRQEEDRLREARQKEEHDRAMREQSRRHEEARLNALPVSARIIVRPLAATPAPRVSLGTRFGNDIEFPGLNPYGQGVPAPKFPAPPTKSPPVQSPGPCVWAVVQCCPTNKNRLVTCFESMGCPGINWDPNPCRGSIARAARDEVARFYAAAEKDEHS